MNSRLDLLEPYPFAKLRALFAQVESADKKEIKLSVGEPQHPPPGFVLDALQSNLGRVANYPLTAGMPALREAIAQWLQTRFKLQHIDAASQVLPVNGTREALFAFAQTVVEARPEALVVCPNPFYQIYEGAALLAGASPHFINCSQENGFAPAFDDVPDQVWEHTQLLYLCSPGNPSGAVIPLAQLQALIELAQRFNFVIASDECYSEIYLDEGHPPPGLLEACAAVGNDSYSHCVAFHSLSKRSNLPGLRSGFVAGDANVLSKFLLYRTYHGCAMPAHHQLGSIAAWHDEAHVQANRLAYREKFEAVADILSGVLEFSLPDAGFYLWPQTPDSDEDFARSLYAEENVIVLPGSYLAREANSVNPGSNRVRIALVPPLADCVDAAKRIQQFVERRS